MYDVYTQETIKEMKKLSNRGYFESLMNMKDIPAENKLVLLYTKIKECEKAATDRILKEATKRRESLNEF